MKTNAILSLFLLCFVGFQFLSFTDNNSEQALEILKTKFHDGLDGFENAIQLYIQHAEDLENNKESIEQIQQTHRNTRFKFKSIEFLVDYFDPSATKRWLNGPPLPSVEANVPEVNPLAPVGLQVLDELVYGEEIFEQKDSILELLSLLESNFSNIKRHQKSVRLTHRHIFEAARKQLIRTFTLGLTGFDTPASGMALPEAMESMKAMASSLKVYYPMIAKKDEALSGEIQSLMNSTIFKLAMAGEFDTFNRLQFLKENINPLYSLLLKAHKTLGIEFLEEVSRQPVALNYHSDNLFAEDFLNAGYYANMNFEDPTFKKRAAIGRLLFFDPILSSNNERSCNSCHQPDKAFTDGIAKSRAIDMDGHISRNSPSLVNAVYSERYFYDMREPQLERQIMHVVFDSLEFATNFATIVSKLEQSEAYTKMFKEAYVNQAKYALSKWSVTDALAAYVASLTSFNSTFDKYVRDEITEIAPAVERGFNLFMGKAACGTCHFAPTFNGTVPPFYTETESEILGVPLSKDTINAQMDPDLGRSDSGRPIDEAYFYQHSFKTVTVRNIAKTAPYMHNGVYTTLEEVVDFYNKGGGVGLGFEVPYQTLPFSNLSLNEQEKKDLVAFMESLTDDFGEDHVPSKLPTFEKRPEWNNRKIGGTY